MSLRTCDPFEIPIPADLSVTLAKVQSLIVEDGGEFTGDATAGRFSGNSPLGTIEGRYTVQGASIRVTITNKPMMAPCGMIEAKVRQYFA